MPAPYDLFDYSRYWEGREFEAQCENIVLQKIFKDIGRGGSLLDIGGGFGRLAPLYSPIFKSCAILDPSEKLLDEAKKNLEKYKNIFFKKGALPVLPFPDASFDCVLMVRVIHHLLSPSSSIAGVERVLKPGGYFILEMANKIHFLARLRAFLTGNFYFSKDLSPSEGRSKESIKENKITFVNHHPKKILEYLDEAGFSVLTIFSVSNFRNKFIKKILPISLLLKLEDKLQKPFGKIFFGPSIFILAKKLENKPFILL